MEKKHRSYILKFLLFRKMSNATAEANVNQSVNVKRIILIFFFFFDFFVTCFALNIFNKVCEHCFCLIDLPIRSVSKFEHQSTIFRFVFIAFISAKIDCQCKLNVRRKKNLLNVTQTSLVPISSSLLYLLLFFSFFLVSVLILRIVNHQNISHWSTCHTFIQVYSFYSRTNAHFELILRKFR